MKTPFLPGIATALVLLLALAGCATMPDPSSAASQQQTEADLVINFQSWNAISFIKPDVSGKASGPAFQPRTFTREGLVKLLNNMKRPRDFVVVVLDRRHDPDPVATRGGMDEIQKFFFGLGYRRVAFHDGASWNRDEDAPVLRDTAATPSQ